jgi:DNA-binding GntR family transcriptional regulator
VSDTLDEVTYTLGRLQSEIEDLAVGGLRAAGPDRLSVLEATREDLTRVGALHLAGRLEALTKAIRAGDREAAAALMRTQASLRVFERLLTLETTGATLAAQAHDEADDDGDDA